MKPKAPLEKDITKSIREFLRFKKIYHWKVRQGLGCQPGIADIIGVMPHGGKSPGTILAIEVKTAKGVFDKKGNQERFLRSISDSGGIAFVARSTQDCIDNLKAYW